MDTQMTAIDPPRLHKLKCEAPHFGNMVNGTKACEVRLNDRNYQVGDFLLLMEVVPDREGAAVTMLRDPQPTGNEVLVQVTHVLPGGKYGIDSQHVVLSIQRTAQVPTR